MVTLRFCLGPHARKDRASKSAQIRKKMKRKRGGKGKRMEDKLMGKRNN